MKEKCNCHLIFPNLFKFLHYLYIIMLYYSTIDCWINPIKLQFLISAEEEEGVIMRMPMLMLIIVNIKMINYITINYILYFKWMDFDLLKGKM